MQFTRQLASIRPGTFRSPGENSGKLPLIDDQTEAELTHLHQSCRPIDHSAHGRPLVPDNHRIRNHRAQPMEKIKNLRSGDPGEQILIAAGKAYHFVWKYRSDDDDLVVIEQYPVHIDLNRHREKTI